MKLTKERLIALENGAAVMFNERRELYKLALLGLEAQQLNTVCVPVEPTVEMVERGWNESRHELAGAASARACYKAMLAAAQKDAP